MSQTGSSIGQVAAAKILPPTGDCPRILITGACGGVGHACATALAEAGADLILCDKDISGLSEAAQAFGAVDYFVCDVASDESVAKLAEKVMDRFPSLDMVINAAGGGYERTLGMYRVSRALLPALRQGTHRLLVNIPPSVTEAEAPIFPYASSRHGFQRLSAALAFEARETPVTVMIACPTRRRLAQVVPDPNSGMGSDGWEVRQPTGEDLAALAWQIASLVRPAAPSRRQAG
jgi:NAD(P)-dependent dehydrogenase (short-subunit alcohol dehydrogenase family)